MQSRPLRRHQALRLLADAVAIACAWTLTITIRVLLNSLAPQQVTVSGATLWAPSLLVVLMVWSLLAWRLGHYSAPVSRSCRHNLLSVLEQSLLAALVVALITVLHRSAGVPVSRSFIFLFLPTTFTTLALARCGTLLWCIKRGSRSISSERTALLGDCQMATQLLDRMSPVGGANVFKGLVVPEGQTAFDAPGTLRVLGTTTQLAEVINREEISEVLMLKSSLPLVEAERCERICQRMGMRMKLILEPSTGPSHMSLSMHHGFPVIEVTPLNHSETKDLLKRMFDVLVASVALVLLAPIMSAIAVAVKLDSEGPVFYRSPRVGKGGRHFICLKFRSMYTESRRSEVMHANQKAGHLFKIKNDPRITPMGRWLRRYSLDELPQILNVLRNEMSIVGPRPLPAADLEPDGMSLTFVEWAEGRARVKPGITGLWQIRGRSELPFEEMVRLDLEYARDRSLLLDIKIMLETPALVLKGIGAY